jgi:hypothetical protein
VVGPLLILTAILHAIYAAQDACGFAAVLRLSPTVIP